MRNSKRLLDEMSEAGFSTVDDKTAADADAKLIEEAAHLLTDECVRGMRKD